MRANIKKALAPNPLKAALAASNYTFIKVRFSGFRGFTLLCIAAILAFSAGCKKDPAIGTASTTSKVKSLTFSSPSGIAYMVNYTYDSLGRQIQSQTDTVVTTYSYSPGTILKTIHIAGETFITTYTTNSWGQAIYDTKGNTYSYDANGYLTLSADTSAGSYDSTFYTILSGNVSSTVEHQGDSVNNNVVTTTNTYLSAIDPRDYGLSSSMGKQNKNLLSSQTVTQVQNGSTVTTSYNYSYTYDNQGRVAQQVQSTGTVSYTTRYTYY